MSAMRALFILAMLVLSVGRAADASACGPDADCVVGERTYRIAAPDDRRGGPHGAILYAHGYKGTAAGVMRNRNLRAAAQELGVALIALQARGDAWSLPNGPRALRAGEPADLAGEISYVEAVLADAAERFGIARERVMATGFSAGGMLIWELACRRSDLAAGFAPISGTFWTPVPDRCPAPRVPLVHIHGTADQVVPMDGRAIGPARQGRVPAASALYRAGGDFTPAPAERIGDLACQRWRDGGDGLLALCLHDGGHRLDGALLRAAWSLLDEAGAFRRTN
jgi:polyhydroxybutyrate depolymerase